MNTIQARIAKTSGTAMVLGLLSAMPATAEPFFFTTGAPDGLIATLSRTASAGKLETETADDFFTTGRTTITHATFTGLIIGGAMPADVKNVEIELYHVFPFDSAPFDGRVPTRNNSPSDVQFAAADGAKGELSFTTKVINTTFTALNSVINGIHPLPSVFTGGEGPKTGVEVEFDVSFTTPFLLGPDHVFFRPEVDLGSLGDFLWLSAPKLDAPDLQSWIRNDDGLAPDWLRIGTDITGHAPFDASFSISGDVVVPEPGSLSLLGASLAGMGFFGWRRRRCNQSSPRIPT
jgi:hypothetical protein